MTHTGKQTIDVVGAGTTGRSIAQVLAEAKFCVLLFDTSAAAVQAGCEFARTMINRSAEKGRMDTRAAKDRIVPLLAIEALGVALTVIKASAEYLEAKRDLISKLDAVLAPEVTMACNTSLLLITAIAAGSAYPRREVGLHFFNPVPLTKVAEVIRGADAEDAAVSRPVGLVKESGHLLVAVADSPGFLVNHAGRGLTTEGLRVVQQGVSEPATIDVLLEAAGIRMEVFELLDLTGLDISYTVIRTVYDQFWQEPLRGGHTEEVLSAVLNLPDPAIADLIDRSIVAVPLG